MNDPILHIVGGELAPKSTTSAAALRTSIDAALSESRTHHLVLHFHGGLVNHSKGSDIAKRLTSVYRGTDPLLCNTTPTNASPRFFVWEAGLMESIENNLGDISREPIFREIIKKVGAWVLKKVPGTIGVKGNASTLFEERTLRVEFDEYFEGSRGNPPAALNAIPSGSEAPTAPEISKGLVESLVEDELAQEIADDIAIEVEFQDAVLAVYNGLRRPEPVDSTSRGAGTRVSAASLISEDGAERLFGIAPSGNKAEISTKGSPISWLKVAKAVAQIVIRVIKRHRSGRDHGAYITISEEVLRSLYVDKLGGIIWNQMKKDTADAFAPGAAAAGTVLLTHLAAMQAATPARAFQRITLIGHSTGALYICNLLDAAETLLPEQQFEVVLLAPAVRCARLAAALQTHQHRISGFRIFAMTDLFEQQDGIVPIIYPHSLLYFVSGLLEWTDEPQALVDEPIAGMQRFINRTQTFTPAEFPDIEACRAYFSAEGRNRAVWSPQSEGSGLSSQSSRHGDFDNDRETLNSVVHILRDGF
jgi:hypothetical protein